MQMTVHGKERTTCYRRHWKWFSFLFLLTLLAHTGSAQTLTLSLKKVSLERAFQEIESQVPQRFIYTSEMLARGRPVTLDVTKTSLQKTLEQVFKGQPLSFSVSDQFITVRLKVTPETTAAPGISVQGKVVNEANAPLSGATIVVMGESSATVSNAEGLFSFNDIPGNAVLLVSFVGYSPRQVSVNGRSLITVALSMAVSTLDEAVVIAYGSATKRFLTGSVSKIGNEAISNQPVTNPVAALQGRAPGVFVTAQNGMPGGNIKVEIRGRGSVAAGTNPLYVIDGIPYASVPLNQGFVDFESINGAVSPLNNINPADIESITVLKDADATALYGSRGANGVILITTRKGKSGETKVDLNFYQGVNSLANYPKYLTTTQYLDLRREGFVNDGIAPDTDTAPELTLWSPEQSTDWVKFMLGNKASVTDVQASVSSGTKNLNFLISANYRKEGTVLPGNFWFQRAGGYINLQHTSTDAKFSLNVATAYTSSDDRLIYPNTFSVFNLPPNYPLYDSAGHLNYTGFYDNPLGLLQQKSKSQTNTLISNGMFKYAFSSHLDFRTSVGYTRTELNQIITVPLNAQNPLLAPYNWAAFGNNETSAVLAEPQLNYATPFAKGVLQVLVGATWQRSIVKTQLVKGINYSNEQLLQSLGAAGSIEYANNNYIEYKYASAFTRMTYLLKNRYVLNGSIRRDGSSRFGPGKQYGNFGAVGAAWIFSEEKFRKQRLPFISFGKLRGSYGLTGNDQISDYGYLTTYTSGQPYQNNPSLMPARLANSLYSWENNRKLEIALELGLWHDRVLLTTSWYRNRSNNQLVAYPLPFLSGFSSYQANLNALVQNTGIEFEVSTINLKRPKWFWSTVFNLTVPVNKLLRYPGLSASSNANRFVVGKDLSLVKGYHFTGIDPGSGIAQFEDVNKDGLITQPQDFRIIGRTSPFYYGGLENSFRYRQLTLGIFIQFSKQFVQGTEILPGYNLNQFPVVLNRWQKPGDQTRIPVASANAGTEAVEASAKLRLSDEYLYNAAYVRLKNAALSYQVPERFISNWHIEGCRVYIKGENVATFKKNANLFDPETGIGGIPPLRTIVFGFHLTF